MPSVSSRIEPDGRAGAGRTNLAVVLAGAALALLMFAPLLRSGFVLLFDYGDYPAGPRPRLSPAVFGFDPGLTARAPVNAVLTTLFRLMPWGPVRVLPLLLIPILASWGFLRLFPRRPVAAIAGTVLFVVNPFSYERLVAGQIYVSLGYALLPLLVSVLWHPPYNAIAGSLIAGMLLAGQAALAPHFLFISGPVVVLFLAWSFVRGRREALRIVLTILVASALSLYWVIPAPSLDQLDRVGGSDLSLFSTMGDERFGLLVNVAGLYGFWREDWPLPKDTLLAWPLLLASILALAVLGARTLHREPGPEGGGGGAGRALVFVLGPCAVLGFFLALGSQGPTGDLFVWLHEHLAGFRIMREPQKFLALTALAYAVFFAVGVERLVGWVGPESRRLVTAVVILIPCIYGFRCFWGFTGYVHPSTYPTAWAAADAEMGDGPEKALVLPWHLYLPLPWADDRVVANPAAWYFRREVILADNLEVGGVESQVASPRSPYIEYLLEQGPALERFGNLVAPLGVRYVLLAKVVDWRDYGWLFDQDDLRVVGDWPDLILFENRAPVALAYAPQGELVAEDWGEVVGLARTVSLTEYLVGVRVPRPGTPRPPARPPPSPSPETGDEVAIRRHSPVRYDLETRGEGPLVFVEPYDPDWTLEGTGSVPNLGATNAFLDEGTGDGPARVEFARWEVVRGAYVIGAALWLVTLATLVIVVRGSGVRIDPV